MRNLIRRTDRISRAPEQDRQQNSGGNMMRDIITGNINTESIPQGIMDNPIVGTVMEGYEQMKPYIPKKIDEQMPGDFYGYEAPVGPGTMTFGADKDLDNFYGGFKFSFEDGGIASLPEMKEMEKKSLTDEQKDYLYDYMLDFMMKQKMREQQEMEGRVPKFNYFDMEV